MNERLWGWGPAICFNKVSRWSWRAVRFENHCSALLGHGCCCSLVAKSCYDSFATPWAIVCQAPLSMGFPSQEHWSGLPFLSPGNLPNPPIEPTSPALAGGFFTTEPPGKPHFNHFWAHGSLGWSTGMLLCGCHRRPPPEHCHHSKLKLWTH